MKDYERIELIRKKLCNDSNSEFAKAIGVSESYASNITKPGKSIGSKLINRILTAFPDINPAWILKGIEPMLLNQESETNDPPVYACRECKVKDEKIREWEKRYFELHKIYDELLEEIKNKKVS